MNDELRTIKQLRTKNNEPRTNIKSYKVLGSKFLVRISGFTLLELLVVISIIAIMITVGLTSFTTSQKKGRDAKRKSDLREVQNALEQYYSVCGFQYPTPTGTFYVSVNCPTPAISIMPTAPRDPRVVTPYFCGPTPGAGTCSALTYTICALLEAESPSAFCVSNQQ